MKGQSKQQHACYENDHGLIKQTVINWEVLVTDTSIRLIKRWHVEYPVILLTDREQGNLKVFDTDSKRLQNITISKLTLINKMHNIN